MSQLVSPANPLAYFRTGMNPYLLYMTLMERADRFRSGTKIWIRCDYRDEVVLERLVPEYNFGLYHVNKYRYLVWNRDEVVPE